MDSRASDNFVYLSTETASLIDAYPNEPSYRYLDINMNAMEEDKELA